MPKEAKKKRKIWNLRVSGANFESKTIQIFQCIINIVGCSPIIPKQKKTIPVKDFLKRNLPWLQWQVSSSDLRHHTNVHFHKWHYHHSYSSHLKCAIHSWLFKKVDLKAISGVCNSARQTLHWARAMLEKTQHSNKYRNWETGDSDKGKNSSREWRWTSCTGGNRRAGWLSFMTLRAHNNWAKCLY